MDGLTFLSKAIDSLAWPTVILAFALMLKKPLIELIPFLQRLKYKELELDFSKQVAELKAEVADAIQPIENQEPAQYSQKNHLLHLVDFSARAAIMEAWLEVESAATAAASSFWNEPPSPTFRTHPRLGEYLLQCAVIDRKQLDTFNKLKQLRNKAAHAEELTLSEGDAKSYIELASSLAAQIRSAINPG